MRVGRPVARDIMGQVIDRLERSRGPRSRKAGFGRPRIILTRAGYPLDARLGLPTHYEPPVGSSAGCASRGAFLPGGRPAAPRPRWPKNLKWRERSGDLVITQT